MHTRTQTTMPICMHACVHVCMLRTYVRTCIHTSIRTCMHAYIRTCIYTYIHVCLSVCLPEKGEALVCMFVCIYQIYIRIYIVDGFLSQRTGPVRPTVSHNLHTSQTRCIFDIKASPSFILFSYCSWYARFRMWSTFSTNSCVNLWLGSTRAMTTNEATDERQQTRRARWWMVRQQTRRARWWKARRAEENTFGCARSKTGIVLQQNGRAMADNAMCTAWRARGEIAGT